MTTINEAETGTRPETTPKSVTEALEYAAAYEQVAEFLAANPDLAKRAHYYHGTGFLACVNSAQDPAGIIVDAARAGRETGARVEEEAGGQHGGVRLLFGPVRLKVYADADKVCSRVVVGVIEDVQYALSFDLDGAPRKQAEVAK